jgi:RNA polymerase sigma-70 factor (ECF subfamily)
MMTDLHLTLSPLAFPLRVLLPLVLLVGKLETDVAGVSGRSLEDLLVPLLERCYGYALKLTRNQAGAADLVQEAALRACRGFETFQPGTNFKAWFYRILTNCFYERHRRRGADEETLDVDEVPELYLYTQTANLGLHHSSPDPAQQLLGRLDAEQITQALDRLPGEYRVVATLYFMEDLSYEEIAQVHGVPVGTVRSRLHRSRRLLQKELWQVAEEHGIVSQIAREAP